MSSKVKWGGIAGLVAAALWGTVPQLSSSQSLRLGRGEMP
jgi:hypothetical protein